MWCSLKKKKNSKNIFLSLTDRHTHMYTHTHIEKPTPGIWCSHRKITSPISIQSTYLFSMKTIWKGPTYTKCFYSSVLCIKRCFQAGFTIFIYQTNLAHAPTASLQFMTFFMCMWKLVEETSGKISLEHLEAERWYVWCHLKTEH